MSCILQLAEVPRDGMINLICIVLRPLCIVTPKPAAIVVSHIYQFHPIDLPDASGGIKLIC